MMTKDKSSVSELQQRTHARLRKDAGVAAKPRKLYIGSGKSKYKLLDLNIYVLKRAEEQLHTLLFLAMQICPPTNFAGTA
jgi:hypothetical protein